MFIVAWETGILPKSDKVFSPYDIVVKNDYKSGNGLSFQSLQFAQLPASLRFEHWKSAECWPRVYGAVRRFMRTLKEVLQIATEEFIVIQGS